ncbi:MAG TPA: zf-HC2 domain-containing protein [bacterium]|nr:zf-HC2 domain-containing protein [bacterium]
MLNLLKKAWTILSRRMMASGGISCEELNQLLIDYVDGTLPDEDRARLDGHLKDCPNCLAMMRTYRKTIGLTREVHQNNMPTEVRERLKRFLDEKMQER